MRSSVQTVADILSKTIHFPQMTKEIIVLSFLKTSGLSVREGQELEVMSMTFLFAHILA